MNEKKNEWKWWWRGKNDVPFWEPLLHNRSKRNIRYSRRYEFEWRQLHFWKTEEWKLVKDILKKKQKEGKIILPSPEPRIFLRPLAETPFKSVKIRILK